MIFAALAALCTFTVSAAELMPARDLQADGQLSRQQQAPILVFFTSDYCPYCEHVRELYLEPMVDRGDYAGRLLVRVVKVEGSQRLRDFGGRDTDHERFALAERATFTPTIRLYNAYGQELVPALRGFSSPDFYGWLLEGAIQAAIEALTKTSVSQRPRFHPEVDKLRPPAAAVAPR
jgi:thioredoxin-related protein